MKQSTLIVLYYLIINLNCSFQIASSQTLENNLIVKNGKITRSDKSNYYFENNKKGNCVFAKNDGMNGPITMIYFHEYDSLDRILKSFFVHSNIGYCLTENVYKDNKIFHFSFNADSFKESEYSRELLKKINSVQEFQDLNAFVELYKSKKTLTSIDSVDKFNNVVSELSFDENGDTSGYNTYQFNKNNKEIWFHLGTKGSKDWTWDIYSEYDQNLNLLKSYRVSWVNGVQDTTELRNYKYDSRNNLLEENYFNKNVFQNKTSYRYNNNNQLIEEFFYEEDSTKIDVVSSYRYNKLNQLIRKESIDYRGDKKSNKETSIYTYKYW